MANTSRYKQMELYMTCALIANAGIFILYLIFAGFGIVWLKVVTSVLCVLISAACLAYLYMSKELLRQRSLWMSAAAAAVLVCLLFSLILNFPSPNKYKTTEEIPSPEASACTQYLL